MRNRYKKIQFDLGAQHGNSGDLGDNNKFSRLSKFETDNGSVFEAEELRIALDVLMKKREQDRSIIEKRITVNINKLVMPFIEKLKNTALNAKQKELVECLESSLDNIKSSFLENLDKKFLNLTPMEIQVACLVREGKSNKEMAEVLCLSINTILSHRSRVRKKLGLNNKKVNLRSYLLSLK